MKATLLYAFYHLEGLWKLLLAITTVLLVFTRFLVETSGSYQCLLGFSIQIPCIFTLITAQRRLKQHQDGWNKYTLTLPISKRKIVLSEFILFSLMSIISVILILLLVICSSIMGYDVSKNDLGIILATTVFVAMNSQLFFYLLSHLWSDKHSELLLVVSIYVTCVLLGMPYFFNREFFATYYAENTNFGLIIFGGSAVITGIVTLVSYKISLYLLEKREF